MFGMDWMHIVKLSLCVRSPRIAAWRQSTIEFFFQEEYFRLVSTSYFSLILSLYFRLDCLFHFWTARLILSCITSFKVSSITFICVDEWGRKLFNHQWVELFSLMYVLHRKFQDKTFQFFFVAQNFSSCLFHHVKQFKKLSRKLTTKCHN
jgi:hypothetical protein